MSLDSGLVMSVLNVDYQLNINGRILWLDFIGPDEVIIFVLP